MAVPSREQWAVPAACGLLAVVVAVGAILPALRPAGWSLTVLPRVDAATGMGQAAKKLDPGFRVVHPGAYDGEFYWGIAVDPIATGSVHQAFDTAPYRYGHPLYGWLGWLFSAGQARAAPAALLAVGLVSMLVAGAGAALLGRARGSAGWEGLAVALNPGLLYAAAHDLTEPLSAALLVLAFLAYVDGRRRSAIVCFALLILSKEQFLLAPLALAAWEQLRRRATLRESAALFATIMPAAAWWVYLRLQLGHWFTYGSHSIVLPLRGWTRALLDAGVHSYDLDPTRSQLGEATIVVLVAVGGCLALAGLLSLRLRGPVEAAFVPLVVIVACLSPAATVYPRDLLRAVAVTLVLVPFVIASPPLLPRWTERRAARNSPVPVPSPR